MEENKIHNSCASSQHFYASSQQARSETKINVAVESAINEETRRAPLEPHNDFVTNTNTFEVHYQAVSFVHNLAPRLLKDM